MKLSFLPYVVCGVWSSVAGAQSTTAPDDGLQQIEEEIRQQREANGSKKAVPDSGFYWLLRAAESLGDNRKPLPILKAGFNAAQQLTYDRDFAEHYRESLRLLRVALSKEIVRPLVDSKPFETGQTGLGFSNPNGNFRQLARALLSESNVRFADGDAKGALDSRLDCFQLGVVASEGTFIDMMTGAAIESIARTKIEPILAKLDAKKCRAAVARLAAIEARRPAFLANIQADANYSYNLIWPMLQDGETRQQLLTPEGRTNIGLENQAPSEAQAREFLALKPKTLRQNIDRFYGAVIQNAKLPFQKAKTSLVPRDVDFVTAMATETVGKPNIRFIYERTALQNRLLRAVIELRAIKLETGAYPTTFDAGIDPFSFPLQSLTYKRDGDKYRLYSIGPDGKDNAGAEIETLVTNEKTGITSVSERLALTSLGDILAPNF